MRSPAASPLDARWHRFFPRRPGSLRPRPASFRARIPARRSQACCGACRHRLDGSNPIRGIIPPPTSPSAGAADVHRLVPAGLDQLIHDHPCGLTDTAGDLYPEFLDDPARYEADLTPLDVAIRAVALGDVWACAWPVPWCAVIRDLSNVRWPDPLDAGVAANPVRVPPADRPAARVAHVARRGRCRSGVEGLDRDAADRDGHPASRCCRNRSSASWSRSTSATTVGTFVRAWAMRRRCISTRRWRLEDLPRWKRAW